MNRRRNSREDEDKGQISDLRFRNFKFQISNCRFALLYCCFWPARRPSPPSPPSTDDQLRDSLNSKTDDDYDRALLGDPAKPDDKSQVDDAMQKKLQKELGSAAQKEGEPTDPLLHVAEEMRKVQQQLDQRDSGRRDADHAAADRRRPGED